MTKTVPSRGNLPSVETINALVPTLGAVALTAFAFVVNFTHGRTRLEEHGNWDSNLAPWGAALPDALLSLCVMKLRPNVRSVPACLGILVAALFIFWSGWATATHQSWNLISPEGDARLLSAWPLLVAVLAAALLESGPAKGAERAAKLAAMVAEEKRYYASLGAPVLT